MYPLDEIQDTITLELSDLSDGDADVVGSLVDRRKKYQDVPEQGAVKALKAVVGSES